MSNAISLKRFSSLLRSKKVESKQDWARFIDLPWQIYGNEPNWVPPLRIAIRDALDPKKNPFFKHARMLPLIVEKDGKIVGRIVGVIDDVHNKFHEEKTVMFGYYEAMQDPEVTKLLLDEVVKWGKSEGMTTLRGPINLSTNNEAGLLVEGFDKTPMVMMTYNPGYYMSLLDGYGLQKAKDLFAYQLSTETKFSEAIYRQAARLQKNAKVTFRSVNMKKFKEEVASIQEIYNDAWERNWGFVPMSTEEFDHMAKDLKAIVDPELILMADLDGKPVGFSVTLPDVNQALMKVKDGKLLPTGLIKLLWHMKGPFKRKTITQTRVVILGIKKAHQELGLGPLFYVESSRRAKAGGYLGGEASWVLEDNIPMNRALQRMCGERTKVYRIYEKAI